MKILLFNLGSIEHRILDWGIEGFNSLFEQDIILWGPIPDSKFMYKEKEIPILRIFEQSTIKSVFNKLPNEWYPDIVTCDTSVLNYIPDMYLCPVKTVLFTRDAWTDTLFNRKLVEQFDFLNHAIIDRSLFKTFHVSLLPPSNCAVSLPGEGMINSEFESREIDVIAIANYDRGFYHERNKNFYKLADSNKNGINIKYFNGIKRPDIYSYYQKSKIVIDWAHTLSNRSYEAALNGCLLFSHTDNLLIKDFWIPWEEYIPYDETNVLELVTYYISNPEHSKRIINKAKEKIRAIPPSWGQYVWENVNIAFDSEIPIRNRITYNEATAVESLHFRSATPLLYNYDYGTNFPPNWEELYFLRIDEALTVSKDIDFDYAPLIEAGRVAFLLKKYELSVKYLNELQRILPDYAWVYYLQARIYFENNENDKSLLSLQKAIQCGVKSPELLREYVLPVIEKGNTCDSRRITNYMWQSVSGHKNEYQVSSFFNLAYELTGDIYRNTGDHDKATKAYCEAIKHLPVPDCIYKVNPLLIKAMDFDKLLKITNLGIEDSPYDSILILYKAYALISLKQNRQAYKVLNDHRNAIKSFVGVRKLLILRYSLKILQPFVKIGLPLVQRLIIEMIRVLKQKIGFIYLG